MSRFINNLAQDGSSFICRIRTIRDGQRKYVNKKFYLGTKEQNKAAALEWLSNQERIRAGLSPSFPHPTTLGELVTSYLERVQGDVKPVTLDGYSRLLSTVLASFGPSHSLFVNQFEIDEYVRNKVQGGAGRGIIAELNVLRYAFNEHHIPIEWSVPKKLYRIPKKQRYIPSTEEYQKLIHSVSPESRLAASMAVFAGLRDQEVFRVGWEHWNDSRGLLVVPASIRKNKVENVLPVVNTLKKDLSSLVNLGSTPATGSIILCPASVRSELRRKSAGKICGLQPFRRLLVVTAESAGYDSDTISLVTGHARTKMVSRYSHGAEQLELKRQILEDVERRLVA